MSHVTLINFVVNVISIMITLWSIGLTLGWFS
jgi:hypothetical protein